MAAPHTSLIQPISHTIVFVQISPTDTEDFSKAMDIYTAAFPQNERQDLEVIADRLERGVSELYIGRLDSEIVFMALLWPLRPTHFILLEYMATHNMHYGKKIAGSFLESMKSFLQKNNARFFMEVEDPGFGSNQEERHKRIQFYYRHGGRVLENVTYRLPGLQGGSATDMLLMIFPAQDGEQVSAAVVKSLIVQVYKELYHLSEADALAGSSGYEGREFINLV